MSSTIKLYEHNQKAYDARLRYHSWMKNDEKRHALSVLVTDIEFADSKGAGKDTVSAQGQSTEPETYDADIPF